MTNGANGTCGIGNPMAGADPFCLLSATQLGAAFRRRELCPVEVVRAAPGRCGDVSDRLDAFISTNAEGTVRAAAAPRKRWRDGEPPSAVDGVPATVKDVVWLRLNHPLNLSQQPACVIPVGSVPNAAPVDLQLAGPLGADGFVLAMAGIRAGLFGAEHA